MAMNRIVIALAAFAAGIGLTAAWLRHNSARETAPLPAVAAPATTHEHGAPPATSTERKVLYWHDPMFPQQRFDKPGKSPFMDMELVPVYADNAGETGVVISARVAQNTGVRTAEAERGALATQVDAVGQVRVDERRVEIVQSRTAGWVEQLHVRALNERVSRGQPLAEIYSPDLVAAQEEYLFALREARGSTSTASAALVAAARVRLAALGLPETQLAALGDGAQAARRITLHAPLAGIVSELGTRQGAAVNAGQPLFTLADLSSVWVTAEIPENASAGVAPGQTVQIRVPAQPGRSFAGRVDYLYPDINEQTRTLRARVVVSNRDGALKPGMLATLSFTGARGRTAVLVPSEALIHTGKRSVVILAEGEGRFRAVDVQAGSESSGKTEILSGLEPGQRVVTSGQFLIDSEASLRSTLTRLEGAEVKQ